MTIPRKCRLCAQEFRSYKGSGQGIYCSDECRFLDGVLVTGSEECWPWQRSKTGRGYGKISFEWKSLNAHRVAYEFFHGPVPADRMVLHRCDNRPCCNPAHLYAGTASDNMRDMVRRGRGAWQKADTP